MNKNILGVIIAVVGVAVLGVGGFFGFKTLFGGVTTNIDYLFEEFAAGNYQEAYDSTASDFRSGASYEQFVEVGLYWELDTIVDAKWSSINITGDLGSVRGTVEHKDGSKTAAHVELIKENDEWKVLTILFGEAATNPTGYVDSIDETKEDIENLQDVIEEKQDAIDDAAEEVQ